MTNTLDRDQLRAQLIRHEALKRCAYQDSRGYWTVAVGRCIDARVTGAGLTEDECLYLLSGDIDRCVRALVGYPWFAGLDAVRQAALVNLMFNIGAGTFARFVRMIAALAKGDYTTAAEEMLASDWATEVGSRAEELSAQLRSGRWQV